VPGKRRRLRIAEYEVHHDGRREGEWVLAARETGTNPAFAGHLTSQCRDSVRAQIRFRATNV